MKQLELELSKTIKSGANLEFIPRKNKVLFSAKGSRTKSIKLNNVCLSDYFRKRFKLSWTGNKFQAKLVEENLERTFCSSALLGVLTAVATIG